ncbi:hypothetical protein F4806DRAFT_491357 [Annulohypoxylon nitens]|nr:hypothetical protein F4806DRAFT_491357 [Annulohypoxylon nitens]
MYLSGIDPTRAVTILVILLVQNFGILAYPMICRTHHSTPTSLIESRNVTQDNNTNEIPQNTYSLTLVETIATSLGLGLAVVTTIITIVECRRRSKNRTSTHERGIIGEARNPVNDEFGREAVDALALQNQREDTNSSNGTPLLIIPQPVALLTSQDATQAIPPKPMPAERPSRGQGLVTSPLTQLTISMDENHDSLPAQAATLSRYKGSVSREARSMSWGN